MSGDIGVLALTRRTHERRVLAALRSRGPSSRAQLAEAARLSRTTLSEIVADLLARGAVVVADTDAGWRRGSGRPAALLALDPGSAQYLGLDLGHRRVAVAIAGAGHEVVARGEAAYAEHSTWRERAEIAVDLARSLAAAHDLHFGAIQGVAAGVTGRSRAEAEPVVAGVLGNAFGLDVTVDNNVRFAGLAEAAEQGRGIAHALYLQLSDGVGGAVIAGGRLHQGTERFAGELGHVVVEPGGIRCRCGKRGCLETVARAGALAGAPAGTADGAPVETADGAPAQHTADGQLDDPRLERAALAVGRVLAAAAMVLNPALIVIGGRALDEHPELLGRIRSVVEENAGGSAGTRPDVRAAVCGPLAGAHGALLGAIHETPLLAGYDDTVFPAARDDAMDDASGDAAPDTAPTTRKALG